MNTAYQHTSIESNEADKNPNTRINNPAKTIKLAISAVVLSVGASIGAVTQAQKPDNTAIFDSYSLLEANLEKIGKEAVREGLQKLKELQEKNPNQNYSEDMSNLNLPYDTIESQFLRGEDIDSIIYKLERSIAEAVKAEEMTIARMEIQNGASDPVITKRTKAIDDYDREYKELKDIFDSYWKAKNDLPSWETYKNWYVDSSQQ